MLHLFDYYDEPSRHAYKVILSTFVSQSGIWYKDANRTELFSVTEINLIERDKIAKAFIDERKNKFNQGIHCKYKPTRDITIEESINHICQYIDLVIPRHYMVLLKEREMGLKIDRSECKKTYTGIHCVQDMIFVYKDNYIRENNRFNTKNERILENKEFTNLNFPYRELTNAILYRMVLQDVKLVGCKLLKEWNELSRLELLRLLHFFYRNKPMDDLEKYIELARKDDAEISLLKSKKIIEQVNLQENNVLPKRGISRLYLKYSNLYDRYNEEVDLVLGMRYGQDGVQPCHSGCQGVCESSSGDSLCVGFLGCTSICIKGTELFIVMCSLGTQCGNHHR